MLGQSDKRNDLYLGNLWWQYQSFVISVHHHYDANGSCSDAPRVLICIAHLPRFRVLKRDVKHPREVLAKMMRRCRLKNQCSTTQHQRMTIKYMLFEVLDFTGVLKQFWHFVSLHQLQEHHPTEAEILRKTVSYC